MKDQSVKRPSANRYQRQLAEMYIAGMKGTEVDAAEMDSAMSALNTALKFETPKREMVFVYEILAEAERKQVRRHAA